MSDTVQITIDGPSKNALGSALMESLTAQIEEAGGAPILLTGAGDTFSAGLDLAEIVSLDLEGMKSFIFRLERLISTLFFYPAPTCAMVNGHAIAGGCLLALSCDLIVAAPNPRARIGLNEVALGLQFPPSLLGIPRYRIPPQHLETVLLEAGLYSPADALALGIVDAVTDSPVSWASEHLAVRARHPSEAYAAAKYALRGSAMEITNEEEAAFLQDTLPTWVSEDLKATLRKFLTR
jgi:enoyl-CoA hydratase